MDVHGRAIATSRQLKLRLHSPNMSPCLISKHVIPPVAEMVVHGRGNCDEVIQLSCDSISHPACLPYLISSMILITEDGRCCGREQFATESFQLSCDSDI
ncbi:hypothetical protein AVEN_90098-1 [Araneus ventricosus]|uniref:Uncharacterized protein n=1 Tax=Araneus ventricosus TaxID=182803 RepID=A0A4Y2V5G9_ARAVE|nr:hypothetical protein AVEN_90098-1 [Araneus ventricosus]